VTAFRIEPAGDRRLAASGELGFATAAAALPAGLALIGPGKDWTVDLAGITTGDSAGLAVLVEWIAVARARGGALRYAGVPEQILAVARISDLERLLLDQSG
jgi:phospholipid transport system transporter-binding protein